MSVVSRQQALLVAEAWQNLYANQSYIDFQSYTQDNLVNAILNYVQLNYPDNFNDWITNSEFVIKVRTLSWLHQNISYRLDLNIRENFIQTATRRQSILMLAQNVFYNANRVTAASGQLRVSSIQTNQPLVDSNGDNLANVSINWNDPANADWFEQFMLVMNAALTPRTQFGHPLTQFASTPSLSAVYMLNSRAPSTGVYPFSVVVNGQSLPFAYINAKMDPTTGVITELPPNPTNAQFILYQSDGLGTGSPGTGFFLPIRQGVLSSLSVNFSAPQPMQSVTLGTANLDNDTIFVQQTDTSGNVTANWTEVQSIYGEGVSFNTLPQSNQEIFQVVTLLNDQIQVQFGDGKFGAIPTDNFLFWYRTVNPIPTTIQAGDIANQSFTIPYVSNGVIYYLTIRASLVATISNGIPTDSNQQIVNNMGAAFAAQNRMVTGQDYNQFPLQDTSILKLNAVNRTYTGHSAYSLITDPTGLYSGVKLLGEDGRLFRTNNLSSQLVSAQTTQVTLDELVLQYITPLIQNADKQSLYYEYYDEILTTGSPTWANNNNNFGVANGNIEKSAAIIEVGPGASDEFKYLIAGTYLRYNGLSGPLITVDAVLGNGTPVGAITLDNLLANNSPIFSLMPPLRNQFTPAESASISQQLFNLQDFGVTWDQTTQSWTIITNANLDKAGNFDLTNQGDQSSQQLDASWFIYLTYIPNGNNGPEWEIVDRGLSVFFESARDVDFVYANTGPLVDPNTGKLVQDNVNVLGVNQGKDSLARLGLFQFGPCCPIIYNFTSNGVTKCYEIRQRFEPSMIFVFVNNALVGYQSDYTVSDTPIGMSICFLTAPIAGATISIRLGGGYEYATEYYVATIANGTETFYPVSGSTYIDYNNTFVYDSGVHQTLGDYSTPIQNGTAGFNVSPPIPSGIQFLGYALAGPQTNIFQINTYGGDGTTVLFDTNFPGQTLNNSVVYIDGIMQTPQQDYSVNNIVNPPNTYIQFATAPAVGTVVSIHSTPFPAFVRSGFFTALGNGTAVSFDFLGFTGITPQQVIVAIDGVTQTPITDYSVNNNGITFVAAPQANRIVDVFVIFEALGFNFSNNNNSCLITYLITDRIWDVVGLELTPDGYTDVNGVQVAPDDSNFNGIPDDPFEFDDIVITDGVTDLVLWQSIIQDGFSVWSPIDQTTVPKGTYGFESVTNIVPGVSFYQFGRQPGDIHLDQTTGKWLIADVVSGNWIIAPDQADFMSATGRSGLYFIWTHYPADNTRIDPSISNIIDMYILTVGYDTAYRTWITSGFVGTTPLPPTSEALQNQYGYLNNFRMTDDALIFHPISYLPLFGTMAADEQQGTFLAIQSAGSTISTNDLILQILNAIDVFFQAQYWTPGQTFYLSELIAFIHRAVAPNLQSIVLVAKDGDAFGTLFEIRCSPDQLFISVAQASDIQVVSSFNNQNLQIGTL